MLQYKRIRGLKNTIVSLCLTEYLWLHKLHNPKSQLFDTGGRTSGQAKAETMACKVKWGLHSEGHWCKPSLPPSIVDCRQQLSLWFNKFKETCLFLFMEMCHIRKYIYFYFPHLTTNHIFLQIIACPQMILRDGQQSTSDQLVIYLHNSLLHGDQFCFISGMKRLRN